MKKRIFAIALAIFALIPAEVLARPLGPFIKS